MTLVDPGHLAREGYEAQMALTMVSMTNMINNIAERDQFWAGILSSRWMRRIS